ncbi:MAG: L-alanine exporter AlaE [Thaumarchaeota archaeon]|nr:L-alanine exporter AlaE [Nitrososphaerota archaeon]
MSKGFSFKRFAVDAGAMAIFWTTLYTPVFLYTSKTLEAALFGLGSSTVLEILFGGVYGRFLDWFRKKFGIIPKMTKQV